MNKEFENIKGFEKFGAYIIYWKEGGSSVAAIGMTKSGCPWVAPTNWLFPTAENISDKIDHVEYVDLEKSVNPPKEPELMTLQEAFDKSSDEDTLSCLNLELKKKFLSSNPITVQQALSTKWKVIPAEPKVLSAEDMLCHMDDFDKNHEPDIVKYGEAMDQNGQLKQWINHKELRESVESFVEYFNHVDGSNVVKFRNALKNIKSLNQNE